MLLLDLVDLMVFDRRLALCWRSFRMHLYSVWPNTCSFDSKKEIDNIRELDKLTRK